MDTLNEEAKMFERRSQTDKFERVRLADIVSPRQDIKPESLGGKVKQVHSWMGKLVQNPDDLLSMPQLPEKTEQEPQCWWTQEFPVSPVWDTETKENKVVTQWLGKLGISDVHSTATLEELQTVLTLSPEILEEVNKKDGISVKSLLEAIRYEFASQIFAHRIFREGKEAFAQFVSPDIVIDEPVMIAVEFGLVDKDNASYEGKLADRHFFSFFPHDKKDPYLDPFAKSDPRRDAELRWLAAHEWVHAWYSQFVDVVVSRGYDPNTIISANDLNAKTKIQIREALDDERLRMKWVELTTLNDAIDEGMATYVQTVLANAEIRQAKEADDDHLLRKLKDARKEDYLERLHTHYDGLNVTKTRNPYYFGLFQIMRKLRARLKRPDRVFAVTRHINQEVCCAIELDSAEAKALIDNPLDIPLITNSQNQHKTIGELVDHLGW